MVLIGAKIVEETDTTSPFPLKNAFFALFTAPR